MAPVRGRGRRLRPEGAREVAAARRRADGGALAREASHTQSMYLSSADARSKGALRHPRRPPARRKRAPGQGTVARTGRHLRGASSAVDASGGADGVESLQVDPSRRSVAAHRPAGVKGRGRPDPAVARQASLLAPPEMQRGRAASVIQAMYRGYVVRWRTMPLLRRARATAREWSLGRAFEFLVALQWREERQWQRVYWRAKERLDRSLEKARSRTIMGWEGDAKAQPAPPPSDGEEGEDDAETEILRRDLEAAKAEQASGEAEAALQDEVRSACPPIRYSRGMPLTAALYPRFSRTRHSTRPRCQRATSWCSPATRGC